MTFNRPEAHNAMTFAMYERLHDACETVDADEELRVLVLRGAGEKAFVAGTDIRQFADFDDSGEDAFAYEATIDRIVGRLEAVRKPTVALVDGYAMGSGLALSAACDLRVCTPAARFGLPIARTVGNCLSMANYARLAALRPGAAEGHRLHPRTIEPEALAIGLATEVVEAERAEARVEELCELLASHAPVTLWATKEALRRIRVAATPDGEDLIRAAYGSEGFRRNVAAFLRDPSSAERDRGGRGRTGARHGGARSRARPRRRAFAHRVAQPRARAPRRQARPAGADPAVAARPARPAGGRRRRGRRGAGVRGRRPLGLVHHVGDPARPRRLRRPPR